MDFTEKASESRNVVEAKVPTEKTLQDVKEKQKARSCHVAVLYCTALSLSPCKDY